MKKGLLFGAVLLVLVLAAVLALPVQADAPVRSTDSWEYHEELIGVCDFPIYYDSDCEVKYISWLDEDGNLARNFQTWGQCKDTFSNPVTGRVLNSRVTAISCTSRCWRRTCGWSRTRDRLVSW